MRKKYLNPGYVLNLLHKHVHLSNIQNLDLDLPQLSVHLQMHMIFNRFWDPDFSFVAGEAIDHKFDYSYRLKCWWQFLSIVLSGDIVFTFTDLSDDSNDVTKTVLKNLTHLISQN